jgi:hypothetical protein
MGYSPSPSENELSPRQQIAIAGIAQGERWQTVADRCQVHRATIGVWLREPKFKAELDRVVGDIRDEALSQVRSLTSDAAIALKGLLTSNDTPPATKLATITKIFDLAGVTSAAQVTEQVVGPSLNLDPDQMATLQEIAMNRYQGATSND